MMGMMKEEEESTHDGNDGTGGQVNNMMGMMEEEEQSTT